MPERKEIMGIIEVNAKKMFGGPGNWVWIAEATVEEGGEIVYVTYQMYDGYELTVSKKSLYLALTSDSETVADVEFLEEYDDPDVADGSMYAGVFEVLKNTLNVLE